MQRFISARSFFVHPRASVTASWLAIQALCCYKLSQDYVHHHVRQKPRRSLCKIRTHSFDRVLFHLLHLVSHSFQAPNVTLSVGVFSMRLQNYFTLFVGFGTLTGFSNAFWRMSCGIIQTGRIDPIVTPGEVTSHVHKIAGASSESLHAR